MSHAPYYLLLVVAAGLVVRIPTKTRRGHRAKWAASGVVWFAAGVLWAVRYHVDVWSAVVLMVVGLGIATCREEVEDPPPEADPDREYLRRANEPSVLDVQPVTVDKRAWRRFLERGRKR